MDVAGLELTQDLLLRANVRKLHGEHARDRLVAGRLVAPFGFLRSDVGYALLSPGPGPDDPRVATLRHWLEMEGRRTRPAKAARDTNARANV